MIALIYQTYNDLVAHNTKKLQYVDKDNHFHEKLSKATNFVKKINNNDS